MRTRICPEQPLGRWLVLAGALVALAPWGCDRAPSGAEKASPAPVAVEVAVVRVREFTRTIRATGTLFGDEEATVAAKVSGRIVAVAKDLGDEAQPGEPLLTIDPTDYQLAKAERERALAQSLARLGLDELPGGDLDIDALPSVERARLQAANAQARFERGKSLADRQPPLISEQDYADLKTAADVAQSELRVERLTASAILAEARLLEAQVATAEQRVADTVHRAPAASDPADHGSLRYEVSARYVSLGDFVQMGAPLFRVIDADPVKLRVTAPERRLGAVRVGQTAAVRVEAFSDVFEGRVVRVSPAVDPATRTFLIEIAIDNPDGRLRPGAFAVAEIEVGRESSIAAPLDAIVSFAGVTKVVVVVDGAAQERRVQVGDTQDGDAEIIGRLSAGETVILRPSGAVVTGTPVVARPGDAERRE